MKIPVNGYKKTNIFKKTAVFKKIPEESFRLLF